MGGKGTSPKPQVLPGTEGWFFGEYPPDCHILCGALSGKHGDSVSVFPGPLWQSGSFFILPAGGGNSRKERKEIMKKLIALVLALTMALTLAACGGNAPETTAPAAASAISANLFLSSTTTNFHG